VPAFFKGKNTSWQNKMFMLKMAISRTITFLPVWSFEKKCPPRFFPTWNCRFDLIVCHQWLRQRNYTQEDIKIIVDCVKFTLLLLTSFSYFWFKSNVDLARRSTSGGLVFHHRQRPEQPRLVHQRHRAALQPQVRVWSHGRSQVKIKLYAHDSGAMV